MKKTLKISLAVAVALLIAIFVVPLANAEASAVSEASCAETGHVFTVHEAKRATCTEPGIRKTYYT